MKGFCVFGSVMTLLFSTAIAQATAKYPPGPPYRSCPDTLTIFDTEQADTTIAPCHPAVGDTVLGIRGIVVGFDRRGGAYATFFETAGGGNYTALQAFTGATNYNGPVPGTPSGGNLAIGDLISVDGTMQEFPATNGTTEIEGPDVVQSTNDIVIRRVSTGNAVPMAILTSAQIHEINWLPAFSNGEKYENGLVRLRGPLKVGRIAGTGIQSPNYLVTCNTCGTDSVLVDAFTLDPAAPGSAPAVGTVIDSIQGIVSQNTSSSVNSYRVQLRSGADVFAAVPPSLSDAYPIASNQIRLLFDRNVDPTTAQTASNYSLASAIDGSVVNAAAMETNPGNVVILTITSALSPGDPETVGVQNVGSASCPSCLLSPAQFRSFINGVLSVADVQAPDPAALAGFPCDDRSRFSGPGSSVAGTRIALSAIAVASFGGLAYLEDAGGGPRSGVGLLTGTPLISGHRYLVAGSVEENNSETQILSNGYSNDLGLTGPPAPAITSITTASNIACDETQSVVTGEDLEGVLVTLQAVTVRGSGNAGQDFRISGPFGQDDDSLLVTNTNGAYTYAAASGQLLNVTGILSQAGSAYTLRPRSNADIAAIERIAVARPPIVLQVHDRQIPESLVPRGVDVLFSPDTVTLVLSFHHTGPAVAHNVVVTASPPAGITLVSSTALSGDIAADASRNGFLTVRTSGLQPGLYPIPLTITSSDSYAGPDTVWIPVWSQTVGHLAAGTGEVGIHGASPFGSYASLFHAPERAPGADSVYFQLQDLRDTVDFVVPFAGIHWGQPQVTRTTTSGPDGSVSVRVQDGGGHPLPGVAVELRAGATDQIGTTDGAGTCLFSAGPSAQYDACVTPPAKWRPFYRATCLTSLSRTTSPGTTQVDTYTFPTLPPGASIADPELPPNAQGIAYYGGEVDSFVGASLNPMLSKTGPPTVNKFKDWFKKNKSAIKSTTVGVLTGVGTGVLDTATFGLSAAAVVALGTAAAIAADPADRDLTDVGEEQTVPGAPTELTQREIISVTCQYPRPATDGSVSFSNQFSFTRVTSANVYTYTGSETVQLPPAVRLSATQLDGTGRRFSLQARDSTGLLSSDQGLLQSWVLSSDYSSVVSSAFAHDDGIGNDQLAGDGTYTLDIPQTVSMSGRHLMVLASRTGFIEASSPSIAQNPSAVWREVPVTISVGVPTHTESTLLALSAPRPNPMQLGTDLHFEVPRPLRVSLVLFDAQGRRLRTLLAEQLMSIGPHDIHVTRGGLAAGIYLCRLSARDAASGAKMVRTQRLAVE